MKSPPPGSLRTHGATEWNPVARTGSRDRRHRSDTQEPEYGLDLNYCIDIGSLLGTRGPSRGAGAGWEHAAPRSQFFCESKTVLIKKV